MTEGQDPENDYVLVFTPTEVIRGLVIDHLGLPVPHARVAYCRNRERFPMRSLEAHESGEDVRREYAGIVIASETGEFTIPRPARGEGVQLLAAGTGMASKSSVYLLPQSNEDVSLAVYPLFAVFLRYTTTDYGGSLADPDLLSGIAFPSGGEGYESGTLDDEQLTFALLGLEFSETEIDRRPYDEWLSFFGTQSVDGIPAIPLGVEVPGYQFWKGELSAFPLSPGIPVQEVLLEQSGEEFGILTVDIGEQLSRTLKEYPETGPGYRARAKIILRPTAGGGEIAYPIRDAVGRKIEILGVPFGEYNVSMRSGTTWWRSCRPEQCPVVTVGPTVAEVYLSSPVTCALVLDVSDANGRPYSGELVIRIRQGGNFSYSSFSAPPYLLYGMDAGEVKIGLRFALGRLRDESSNPLGNVTALEGQLIHFPVRLPE